MAAESAGVSPATGLIELVRAYQLSQAVCTAATLGIADLLVNGPRDAPELARATGTHAPSLHRLLRALASRGLFALHDDGRFALTPMAELLRNGGDGSLRDLTMHWGRPAVWEPWGDLLHSVRTGEAAFEYRHGVDLWAYLAAHPEDSAAFDAAMANSPRHAEIAATYDFSDLGRIVDVGGGNGRLLAAILERYPGLHGVVFDQPHVIAAGVVLELAGVMARCELVGGDFFAAVPTGADAYVLSHVIMDWDDDRATVLLANCRRAMAPQGRVLVAERIIPAENAPSFGQLDDLMGLAVSGGRIRTEQEHRRLFEAAGLRLTNLTPTPSGSTILEGRAA
jgi:SAM-dependent methyltransferase